MEHGYAQLAAKRLFYIEAFRRLDVLQVDPAERRFHQLDDLDDVVRVVAVDFNVEDIDVGKALEEHSLAFHYGLAGRRADVAQAQNRRPVGHHRHQVALGRVIVDKRGILVDLETGNRHTGRVCQGQVALGAARFGGYDFNFSFASP